MEIYDHYPLVNLSTFRTPATARRAVLVHGDSIDGTCWMEREVGELLGSGLLDEPYLILGDGSNVLFSRDYEGSVIKFSGANLRFDTKEGRRMIVGSRMRLDEAVRISVARGWGGAENLTAIPGTVGGAVVQNAGAYGAEMADVVEWVKAVDLERRDLVTLGREDCRFAYRSSLFKERPGRYFIVEVCLGFSPEFTPNLHYRALADELRRRGLERPTQQQVRATVAELRWSKLPRPEEYGSAGSFFKNPVVDEATCLRLKADHPDMPEAHPASATQSPSEGYKISAGWLIDRAGWKGRTLGRAGVWPRQALVLYNCGGATGEEVLDLATAIRHDVRQQFGVDLQPEAIIV